ncbi:MULTISPECIES: ATP-binding protein [Calothrix]|uniref:histidine kinase n=2 Tax=Calothrix TaxID=1186 RepID=A0ABR8AGT9_9CYAN|nr:MULTISPECIES: ATP-binding protein [Calothrix]MBD2199250.1 response regulator [Calothrix parietina FACHB-288]MBD2227952.1 response regulator [Calothrix anomala FACHB-343]
MEPSDTAKNSEFLVAETMDFSNCDREPIHTPGLIQPHGILLTLSEPKLEIIQISENVRHFLGIAPEKLLGKPLACLCSKTKVKEICQYLQQDNLEVFSPLKVRICSAASSLTQHKKPSQNFTAILHRSDGLLVMELEPIQASNSKQFLPCHYLLKAAIAKIRQAATFNDLLAELVKQTRKITGFDRVMVYQFADDNSGVVVAEDKAAHLETYLNLHYPSTDITLPAYKLLYENWLRLIPDVNYQPVRLIPTDNPLNDTPLDLSHAHLRSMSPCHQEYLQNMGVAASMSISLINEKRLWGVISCHHYQPKYIDYEMRKACEFLGQFASLELVYQQAQEINRYRLQGKLIQEKLRQAFAQEISLIEPVLRLQQVELLNLVHAQGAALILDHEVSLLGETPSAEQVQALMNWLLAKERQPMFVTDSLSLLYPQAQEFKTVASGVLVISIMLRQKSYHIVWFRPEQIQIVHWAGDPHQAVSFSDDGEMRLSPRKSFELWKQIVEATSLPWQTVEIEAAWEMRNTLMLGVLEFSQQALEQAAERAAIANLAKSQFLAKMSHELRTPLNAILGFTQLMSRDRDTPSEFQENLSIISRSGEHLLTMINDVLEMSRIEAGQLHLSASYFDLHRLFASINDMFALKASEKGLYLSSQWDATVPHYVYGDEAKLRQILINLLGNAIKFTTTGRITVRAKAVALNDTQSKSPNSQPKITLNLEIEDTGCGIAQGDVEAIFTAFIQTEQGRHAQGTGLGLSISRQFARLMGGEITVRSNLNQGSTFICQVCLSVATSVDLVPSPATRNMIGLEPGQPIYRILVAEDVLENRQLLIKLLQSVGFEVCAVENGAEAIAQWREWQPHLIWMDMQMPVMNGYIATQQIRATEGGEKVIIIALTASAFEEDRLASMKAGCNDYLAKPFTETALFEKMTQFLGVGYLYSPGTTSGLHQPSVQPPSLTPQDLQIMPADWISQMHEAALDLNDAKLYELIAQISPQEQPLADALKYLVDNFQLEAIANLTEF